MWWLCKCVYAIARFNHLCTTNDPCRSHVSYLVCTYINTWVDYMVCQHQCIHNPAYLLYIMIMPLHALVYLTHPLITCRVTSSACSQLNPIMTLVDIPNMQGKLHFSHAYHTKLYYIPTYLVHTYTCRYVAQYLHRWLCSYNSLVWALWESVHFDVVGHCHYINDNCSGLVGVFPSYLWDELG